VTVRAWFTISAVVVAALGAALFFQFTRSVAPPEIVVHAGNERLEGTLASACWPQHSGDLRCEEHEQPDAPVRTIAGKGSLRVVLLYPAEPKNGSILIARRGKVVLRSRWRRTLRYDLEPGDYTLTAQAGAPDGAYVRYLFRVTVTRSGS
jgi:hypothetical protein